MKKLLAIVLIPALALSITVVTHLAPLRTPLEESTHLMAEFVPQYDPPPPRKPKK